MSLGIYDSGNAVFYVPDKTLSRSSTPKILLATYGDGYEQRIADGINSNKEEFSLSFRNRLKEDIDDIVSFLVSTKGVTNFDFTIPDTNGTNNKVTVQAICVSYDTIFEHDEYYSLTVNLKRVYEP